MNNLNIARKIFEGTKYQASEEDVGDLAKNMSLLEKRGLDKLNRRLIDGGRKIWDTFSEHNFGSMLIPHHSRKIPISYEPEEFQRPPDFKVVLGRVTYWIQMKRLANLERVNRQDKIVQKIKMAAHRIEVGMFFGCNLSEEFFEDDIPDLTDFITKHAKQSREGEEHFFPASEKPKAKVSFWRPNKTKLSNLTLGTSGDMNMVEVTGLARDQIRGSLTNAAGAFSWNIDNRTINLVAMDADRRDDIDLCDAVFGTEFDHIHGNNHAWYRKNDGFFKMPDISDKLVGVIAVKRKKQNPVSDCFSLLFINDRFKERLDDLNSLLPFDKVIHFNMRPPMGKGNFDLA